MKNVDYAREARARAKRRRVLGGIRTATRRLIPSRWVLLLLAALAWGLAQIVTVKPVAP